MQTKLQRPRIWLFAVYKGWQTTQFYRDYDIPPNFNSSPLKNNSWKSTVLLGWSLFRAMLNFRGVSLWVYHAKWMAGNPSQNLSQKSTHNEFFKQNSRGSHPSFLKNQNTFIEGNLSTPPSNSHGILKEPRNGKEYHLPNLHIRVRW